jgi:hypothetical protein
LRQSAKTGDELVTVTRSAVAVSEPVSVAVITASVAACSPFCFLLRDVRCT